MANWLLRHSGRGVGVGEEVRAKQPLEEEVERSVSAERHLRLVGQLQVSACWVWQHRNGPSAAFGYTLTHKGWTFSFATLSVPDWHWPVGPLTLSGVPVPEQPSTTWSPAVPARFPLCSTRPSPAVTRALLNCANTAAVSFSCPAGDSMLRWRLASSTRRGEKETCCCRWALKTQSIAKTQSEKKTKKSSTYLELPDGTSGLNHVHQLCKSYCCKDLTKVQCVAV